MSGRSSYAAILDAIGLYAEQAGGSDILVNELADGYLVAFLTQGSQRVATFDQSEMAQLLAAADRQAPKSGGGWFRRRGDHHGRDAGRRAELRALGRYLDSRSAAVIVVQERADGYALEFTGIPTGPDAAYQITRINETLSVSQIADL